MSDPRIGTAGVRARHVDDDFDAPAPEAAPDVRNASRTAARRFDDWILTHAPTTDAAVLAAASAGPRPSCGPPRSPTSSGIPETFKATDADAIRQWGDPSYAERRRSEQLADAMRVELGKLAVQDRMRLLVVPPPDPVTQAATLGPIAIPIAGAVHTVASLAPVVGELVAGAEAITGRGLFGLGEKLSEEERAVSALLAATIVAGPILEAGAKGARVLVQIAQKTGRSADQIVASLAVARSLSRDEAVLREAMALRRAGRAIEPRHEVALRRAGAALDEVRGAAKHSRFDARGSVRSFMSNAEKAALPTFAPNPSGAVRSASEAVAIAKKNGVEVPSWVKIVVDESVPADRFADYTLVRSTSGGGAHPPVRWSTIAPHESIVVRLHPSVARSDEAIAAVVEHECYELERIKRTLDARGAVSADELARMVDADVANNLHHQAWEVADLRVLAMRAKDAASREAILERRARLIERYDVMNFGRGSR